MSNKILRLIYHVIAAVFSTDIVYWSFTVFNGSFRIEDFVQLTTLNFIWITLYYYLAIFRDIQELQKSSKEVTKSPKTYLLFWTVFACSHLVSLGYWFLRLTNKESVIPPEEAHIISWRSNVTHGGNVVMLYLEIILFGVQNYRDSSFMWIFYSLFTLSYIILQIIYNFSTGLYVYPFLKTWPNYAVAIFYFTLYLVLIAAYEIGQKVKGDKKIKQKLN